MYRIDCFAWNHHQSGGRLELPLVRLCVVENLKVSKLGP